MELDTVVKRMVLTLKCVLLFVNWQSFVFLLKILNIHCCFENEITKFDDVNGRSNRSPVQLHLFIYTLDFSSSVTLHKRPKLSALLHNKVKVPDIFIVCIIFRTITLGVCVLWCDEKRAEKLGKLFENALLRSVITDYFFVWRLFRNCCVFTMLKYNSFGWTLFFYFLSQ